MEFHPLLNSTLTTLTIPNPIKYIAAILNATLLILIALVKA